MSKTHKNWTDYMVEKLFPRGKASRRSGVSLSEEIPQRSTTESKPKWHPQLAGATPPKELQAPTTTPTYAPKPVVSAEVKAKAKLMFEKQEYDSVFGEVPKEFKKNSTNIYCGDGLWLARKNQIGIFIRQMSKANLPGLPVGPPPSFTLLLPRIPKHILKTQICFYREVMKKHANAEAYTMILWDLEKKEYTVVCPNQRVSGASVVYDFGTDFPTDRYLHVVSCHSHNTMNSFWSSVDDADEKGDMLYMVMGTLNKDCPSYKIRASVAGKEVKGLNISEIFEEGFTDEELKAEAPHWIGRDFPEEWMTKLNPSNMVSRHGNTTSYGSHSGYQYEFEGAYGNRSWDSSKPGTGSSSSSKGTRPVKGGYFNDDWYDQDWDDESRFSGTPQRGRSPANNPSRTFEGGVASGPFVIHKDYSACRAAGQHFMDDLRKVSFEDALWNFMDRIGCLGYTDELRACVDVLDSIEEHDLEAALDNDGNHEGPITRTLAAPALTADMGIPLPEELRAEYVDDEQPLLPFVSPLNPHSYTDYEDVNGFDLTEEEERALKGTNLFDAVQKCLMGTPGIGAVEPSTSVPMTHHGSHLDHVKPNPATHTRVKVWLALKPAPSVEVSPPVKILAT